MGDREVEEAEVEEVKDEASSTARQSAEAAKEMANENEKAQPE